MIAAADGMVIEAGVGDGGNGGDGLKTGLVEEKKSFTCCAVCSYVLAKEEGGKGRPRRSVQNRTSCLANGFESCWGTRLDWAVVVCSVFLYVWSFWTLSLSADEGMTNGAKGIGSLLPSLMLKT
jgi:hypothetical protein